MDFKGNVYVMTVSNLPAIPTGVRGIVNANHGGKSIRADWSRGYGSAAHCAGPKQRDFHRHCFVDRYPSREATCRVYGYRPKIKKVYVLRCDMQQRMLLLI